MHRIQTEHGVTISYEKEGSGPPLILVHGAFSDHRSNWEFVLPLFARRFTVYAIARRGRGETDRTEQHSLEDESRDVVALMRAAGEPCLLLGHSYGAHVALGAALLSPESVRKLVLYEPPRPGILTGDTQESLARLAQAGDWDRFSFRFFESALCVPTGDLNALRATELWAPIVADARATVGDLRALSTYDFRPERFRELGMPVLLQIGSESPGHLYATDALADVLGDVRIGPLEGQAHEGMTTAPELYAESVVGFWGSETERPSAPKEGQKVTVTSLEQVAVPVSDRQTL